MQSDYPNYAIHQTITIVLYTIFGIILHMLSWGVVNFPHDRPIGSKILNPLLLEHFAKQVAMPQEQFVYIHLC